MDNKKVKEITNFLDHQIESVYKYAEKVLEHPLQLDEDEVEEMDKARALILQTIIDRHQAVIDVRKEKEKVYIAICETLVKEFVNNPAIDTHDMLEGMKQVCSNLIQSDF